MKFCETPLAGAFVIEFERREDERGFFARSFCTKEFSTHGLNPRVAQCNVSFNWRKGTLRGMHCQSAPHPETKLVRCTAGAVFDVIIDIRPASPTHKKWFGVELSARAGRMLYIPEGFAHGFQTLEDNSEMFYQISEHYAPELAHGVRWDDPAFGIDWPIHRPILSARDAGFEDYRA